MKNRTVCAFLVGMFFGVIVHDIGIVYGAHASPRSLAPKSAPSVSVDVHLCRCLQFYEMYSCGVEKPRDCPGDEIQ